jgi:Ni,Fe-hydrogenase III large subunit
VYPPANATGDEYPLIGGDSGDVFARAQVRRLEITAATDLIREKLACLSNDPVLVKIAAPRPEMLAVSLVEGWRGRLAHVALTDGLGKLRRYKVVDPSFYNWTGLALAMRDEQISDFPLCNKSFNLSYCGFDL